MATPVVPAVSPRAPVIPARAGAEAAYGLCYGTKTSQRRPTPGEVVEKYRSHRISKMLLSPTPLSPNNEDVISILEIIINDPDLKSKMKIVLGIDDLSLISDYTSAKEWVGTYIERYARVISHVCVGDVIGSVDFTSPIKFKDAIRNLGRLLSDLPDASDPIKVSTFVNESILLGDSYTTNTRPSTCVLTESSKDLLRFQSDLLRTPIPLFVRIMPYFRIVPDNISVENCILNDMAPPYMHDNVDKEYSYNQAFDAMVDSICCALKKLDLLGKVDIHVVSGWPTAGPTIWASEAYARQYISNLVQHIGKPTPMNNKPVDIFIYSMEDEDLLEERVEEFKHLGAEPYLP